MIDRVGRHADIGRAVVRQDGVAAVRVAGAAREITTDDVDLQSAAGADRMVDVRQVDRDWIDRSGFEWLRVIVGGVEDRLPIQGRGSPHP